jgi:hypothetical protein
MAIGTVTKYNQFLDVIMGTDNRQWDDVSAGSGMFVLVTNGYTPAATHTTAADLGVNVITSGDGAPINVASAAVNNSTGTTWLTSANASFGSPVTIIAKYLICVQPVVAGTYASTAKLLWYLDLDTTSSSTSVSSTNSEFSVNVSANGWVSIA